MARHLHLLTGVLLLVVGLTPPDAASARASGCTQVEANMGSCVSAGITGDDVVLGGGQSTPGDAAVDFGVDDTSDAPADEVQTCLYVRQLRCIPRLPIRAQIGQPVTLADIAQFRPDAATDSMEPNGWAVVGLPSNIFASAGVQVHNGELLGRPASVRFTPVTWHWSYGDATTAHISTGGGSWADIGVREFDQTPTSHTFTSAGTYTIELTID